MKICLCDDSIAFDGRHPSLRPLGGAQRAVVSLAEALAARGHTVVVQNRCPEVLTHAGVHWLPLTEPPPDDCELLIACRKPSLLEALPARRRLLWAMGAPEPLAGAGNADALAALEVAIVFLSHEQRSRYHGTVPCCVIEPGVSDVFRLPPPSASSGIPGEPPPVALSTVHPAHGLDRLIDIWADLVLPAVPKAELHLYSSLLARPLVQGEPVPPTYRGLAERLRTLPSVVVKAPLGDVGMAAAYSAARLHLYAGHAGDLAHWTLGESQACGLPAVALQDDGSLSRVDNGRSGYLVPDIEALGNVAVQVLGNDSVYHSLTATPSRCRRWAQVAEDFERLCVGEA